MFVDASDDAPSQRDLTCAGASVTTKGCQKKLTHLQHDSRNQISTLRVFSLNSHLPLIRQEHECVHQILAHTLWRGVGPKQFHLAAVRAVLNKQDSDRFPPVALAAACRTTFLDELLLGLPLLLGAKPALSGNSHISDSLGAVPYDENEFVCLIRGEPFLHFLISTPANSSQIVLRTVSDSSVLQEVIP